MKQLIHICLSMLLVMATMGVTLHQHYCGEELRNSGLEKFEGCCSEDAAESAGAEDMGCCENSTTQLQADSTFQLKQYTASIALLPAALPQIFLSFFEDLQKLVVEESPLPLYAEAPPLNGPPYLASLCVLLI